VLDPDFFAIPPKDKPVDQVIEPSEVTSVSHTTVTEQLPAEEATATAEPARACVSCGAALTAEYCALCGEKVLSDSDLDWRHFVLHELPDELVHADGRLPRTLASLFTRPGELAQAFVSGRRRVFIAPLKLYFAVFVVYALTANFAGVAELSLPERIGLTDSTHLLHRLLEARGTVAWSDLAVQERITSRMHWLSEAATFLIYVFVALVQQVVLRSTHRRYLEHLALALNVSTFYLLVTAAAQLMLHWSPRGHVAAAEGVLQTVLALTALPLYWYLSVRRFYGIRRPWAAAVAVTVTASNALIAIVLNTAIYAVLIVTS